MNRNIQKAVEEIKATGMETFLNQEPTSYYKRSRSCLSWRSRR